MISAPAPSDRPCAEPWRDTACQRPAGHDGLHSSGTRAWGFRDPFMPEWRKRALARPLGLARDETGAVLR